jgi:hypothetical protein
LTEDLHVSGHAAQEELKLMINLAKPKNLMPMGGNFRHMRAFTDMVKDMGYKDSQIFALNEVQAIEIGKDRAKLGERIREENVYVDGFGVGDVGQVILLAGDHMPYMSDDVKSQVDLAVAVSNSPLYPDLIQPAARELGKDVETIAKTISIAFAPLRGLVWGWEKIEGFLSKKKTASSAK